MKGYNRFTVHEKDDENPRTTYINFKLRYDAPYGLLKRYEFRTEKLAASDFDDIETPLGAVRLILKTLTYHVTPHKLIDLQSYLEMAQPFDEVDRLTDKLTDLKCQLIDTTSQLEIAELEHTDHLRNGVAQMKMLVALQMWYQIRETVDNG